ncbi:MAG: ribonuclease PH, partial [Deltaproteobacteria bacterium]|nr:ribonuclease PH [Deltaproteobacteria bacterium]
GSGRTLEIQRLIGRSLRAGVDLNLLGQRTIWVDCDVLQADGGTRVASVTGGFVAMRLAVNKLIRSGKIRKDPVISHVAGLSLGYVGGELLVDLDYSEDSKADVDCNIVMNSRGEFIEIQGTGERGTFSKNEFDGIIAVAAEKIENVFKYQFLIFEK